MPTWVLGLLCLAFAGSTDWSQERGNAKGSMRIEGVGALDGSELGRPEIVHVRQDAFEYYGDRNARVGDFRTDITGPEVIGVSRGRVYLWGASGSVIASSETIALAGLVGVYDLDGDGLAAEVVVTGEAIGGGLAVLDAASLSEVWRAPDSTGMNSGVIRSEVQVADFNDDGASEIFWGVDFAGFNEHYIANFVDHLTTPALTTLLTPAASNATTPLAVGNFRGTGHPAEVVVDQSNGKVSIVRVTDVTDPTAVVCSETDAYLCLAAVDVETFTTIGRIAQYGSLISADIDGDPQEEVLRLTVATNAELAMFDPLDAAAGSRPRGLKWYIGYGGTLPSIVLRESGVRGVTSSTSDPIVAYTYKGDAATEVGWDPDGALSQPPAAYNDCSSASNTFSTFVVDGATGLPLAHIDGATLYGSLDGDHDGISEIIVGLHSPASSLTPTSTAAYELVCTGLTNTSAWNGCGDTGCSLVPAWTLAEPVARVLAYQPRTYASYATTTNATQPLILQLQGDSTPEIVTQSGTTFHAYRFGTAGVLDPYGEYNASSVGCRTPAYAVPESGGTAWLLFSGSNCFNVLDGTLAHRATVTVDTLQGSTAITSGFRAAGAPRTVSLGTKLYYDPASYAYSQSLVQSVTMWADLDGDGIDEGISAPTLATSTWTYRVFRWNGSSYTEWWSASATALGETGTSLRYVVGDFDADGDPDLGVYAIRSVASQAMLWFLDGRGSTTTPGAFTLLGSVPAVINANNLLAVPRCPDGSCAGDDVVLPRSSSIVTYRLGAGQIRSTSLAGDWFGSLANLDGDADPELLLRADTNTVGANKLAGYELDGTQKWLKTLANSAGSAGAVATGDLDGDGDDDIVRAEAYGGLEVYDGATGVRRSDTPFYLLNGEGSTIRPVAGGRRILELSLADIDGDDLLEAIVAHDDGYTYAVNLDVDEPEGPSVLWAVPFGASVVRARPFDADGDDLLEIAVQPNDGMTYLIDNGTAHVTVVDPSDGECVAGATFTLTGTAAGVSSIYVENQCDYSSAHEVPVVGGTWTSHPMPWVAPEEARCTVRVYGIAAGMVIANAAISVTHSFDGDGDGVSAACSVPVDCDDTDPTVYPGAPEVDCDYIDNDCDGIDEGDEYTDADFDTFNACEDCDDSNPAVNAIATEIPYDGLDNDCADGDLDDLDEDGVAADLVAGGTDCDDGDAEVRPGAMEVPDGVDEDCDGIVDEGTVAYDDDGDGFTEIGGDCDDLSHYAHPAGSEVLNGEDDDCDGRIDDGTEASDDDADGFTELAGDCDDTSEQIAPDIAEMLDGLDNDCDGSVDEDTSITDDDSDGVSEVGGDCDDATASVHPGATEAPNGADDDCDGEVDEGTTAEPPDPLDTDAAIAEADPTVYVGSATTDDDGDGYAESAGDCDDSRGGVGPGRAELCTREGQDVVDENCDGTVDEGCEHPLAEPAGCGCSTPGTPGTPFLGLVMVFRAVRRRRSLCT